MAEPIEQLLLRFGIDITAVKQSAAQIKSILGELSTLSQEVSTKATAASGIQKEQLDQIKSAATAAVALAKQAVQQEQVKAAASKATAEALKVQAQEQRNAAEASKANIAQEQAKKAAISTQTAEIQKQIQERRAETAEITKQIAELRKKRIEEGKSGGEGKREGGGLGGILGKIGGGLLGKGMAGSIAGGILAGGGIGLLVEQAGEGVEHLVDKLKEVIQEAGKLSILQDVFEKLAKGAGVDAAELMTRLQESTEGLIDKFSLLRLANAALKSPFKITSDQLVQLTGDVVKLAESTGKPGGAEAGLQRVNRALEMGNARSLAFATGISVAELRLASLPPGINRVQRQMMELQHAIEMIHKRAEEMGELPQTFEQMATRMNVAVKDILTSFGKGVNESPGSQIFISMISGFAKNLRDLSNTAESIGRKVGLAIGIAAPAIQVVKDLLFGLVEILGTASSAIIDLFTAPGKNVDPAKAAVGDIGDAFLKLDTILSVVLTTLNAIVETIKFAAKPIADTLQLYARGETNTGKLRPVSSKSGNFIGPQQVTSSTKFVQTEKPLSAADEWKALSQIGEETTKAPKDLADAWGKVGTAFEDSKKKAEDFKKTLDEAFNKTKTDQKGIAPHEVDETETAQQRERDLANEQRIADAIYKTAVEHHKLIIAAQKAALAEQKQIDDAAYQDGTVSLQEHLNTQLRITKDGHKAEIDEAATDYQAKLTEFAARQKKLDAEKAGGLKGPQKSTYDADQAVLDQDRIQSQEAFEAKIIGLDKNFQQQRFQLQQKGAQDLAGANRKAIGDELAMEQERIASLQQINEKQFAGGNIDIDTYYAKRLELIRSESLAKINAAHDEYAAAEQTGRAKQAMLDSIRKAEQQEQEKTDAVNQDRVEKEIANIQKLAQAKQQQLQGQLTIAQAPVSVAPVSQQKELMQAIMKAYQNEIDDLTKQQSNLGTGPLVQQSEAWIKITMAIQQATIELNKYNQEYLQLQQQNTAQTKISGTIGAITSSVAEPYTSKFVQNLASTVQRAISFTQKAPQYQATLAAATPQTGKTDTGETYSTFQDNLSSFTTKISTAAQAVGSFISSLTNAKSALTGGVGGALGGAGMAKTLSGITGLSSLGGTAGQLVGVGVGAIFGAIVGQKQAQVQRNITDLQNTFKQTMQNFALNTNNLNNAIVALSQLVAQAQAMQSSSKKGGAQYQQLIDQYNQQIMSFEAQQNQIIVQMNEQLAVLSQPIGMQSYLQTLEQILQQYSQMQGAAQNAQQLAEANQFLASSLSSYEQNLATQWIQDNQNAINDALQLNDLLQQRLDLTRQTYDQIEQVLSQGVLSRQMTRSQTAGQQIEQINYQYSQQMDQLNEQISATQYRVQAEQQIFTIASTRIGLEAQLLTLQNAQTDFDMQRISALGQLVDALSSGNSAFGPLMALINSLPSVTNPAAGTTPLSGQALMDQLMSSAYQDRASMGYAAYRGTNISG